MSLRRLTHPLLQHKLIRFALLALVLAVFAMVLRYAATTKPLREDLESILTVQQMALANYVARDVDFKLTERNTLLSTIAATLPLRLLDHPAQLRQWLAEQQHRQPLFSQGLLVTDASGRAIADYPQRAERTPGRLIDRAYIQSSLAGEATVGRPVVGRAAHEPVLPMSAPIKDASGTVRGVLVGVTALGAPGFLSLSPENHGKDTADFLLVSPHDQLFVASTQPKMVLRPTPPVGVDAVVDRAMSGYRGTGLSINSDGVEEVAAVASVASTGWFVVARNPSAEALQSLGATTRNHGLLQLPMVLVLLVIATVGVVFIFQPERITQRFAPFAAPIGRLLPRLHGNKPHAPRMTLHDNLTGLPSRSLLKDRMGQALSRAHRNERRVGLLIVDLGQFKALNEELGRDAGDAALMEMARRLAGVVRESDTLARLGTDQFAVVMGELDNDAESAKIAACAVAAKCLDCVLPLVNLHGVKRQLRASIGIALSDGTMGWDELQTAANRALSEAKQAGGDRYCVAATLQAAAHA
jgi:diguanylate cyclase (GGDEF)-like protein